MAPIFARYYRKHVSTVFVFALQLRNEFLRDSIDNDFSTKFHYSARAVYFPPYSDVLKGSADKSSRIHQVIFTKLALKVQLHT